MRREGWHPVARIPLGAAPRRTAVHSDLKEQRRTAAKRRTTYGTLGEIAAPPTPRFGLTGTYGPARALQKARENSSQSIEHREAGAPHLREFSSREKNVLSKNIRRDNKSATGYFISRIARHD